jgi:MFS family permease
MNPETFSPEKIVHRRLFLPALGLAVFSVWLVTVTFQLLLIDIAHTFQVQVGTAGLVAAVGSISGIVAGLLMSVLSVRFNHKLFLLIGLVCTSLSAVGFFGITRKAKSKLARAIGKANQIMTERQPPMLATIPITGAPMTYAKVVDATIQPMALPLFSSG